MPTSAEEDGEMTELVVEWLNWGWTGGQFLIHRFWSTSFLGHSIILSHFEMVMEWLICHSMVILSVNDLAMTFFSFWNAGEMTGLRVDWEKFSNKGICPRFGISLIPCSFTPYFIIPHSFHNLNECRMSFHHSKHIPILSCHIGRQGYRVYAYYNSHSTIIQHHSTIILTSNAI